MVTTVSVSTAKGDGRPHRYTSSSRHTSYNKPEVDHRDVNQLNNDVRNLRWVTHLENCQNRGMYSNNTTGVTGVYLRPNGMFRAQIRANNKKHTKTFKTEPEAIAWYATMKATLHIK